MVQLTSSFREKENHYRFGVYRDYVIDWVRITLMLCESDEVVRKKHYDEHGKELAKSRLLFPQKNI